MRDKKIPSTKLRSEIIADNIFKYLEKNQLKQKDLAEACIVSPSDVSKWKNYKSKVNIDDLEKIALFLKVTVKDLYYSEEEKKRGIPELSDKVDPSTVLTQRLAHLSVGAPTKKVHLPIILMNLFLMLMLFLFINIFKNKDGYNLLISLIYILIINLVIKFSFHEVTYIVNYMSDVFFKIKDNKNQYFISDIIIKTLSIVYSVVMFFVICYVFILNVTIINFLVFFAVITYMFFSFGNLIRLKKKYKDEVYSWEFDSYRSSFNSFTISSVILVIFVYMCIEHSYSYVFIIFAGIDFFLRMIEYILTSMKCSEYKIAMIDENKKISYLS